MLRKLPNNHRSFPSYIVPAKQTIIFGTCVRYRHQLQQAFHFFTQLHRKKNLSREKNVCETKRKNHQLGTQKKPHSPFAVEVWWRTEAVFLRNSVNRTRRPLPFVKKKFPKSQFKVNQKSPAEVEILRAGEKIDIRIVPLVTKQKSSVYFCDNVRKIVTRKHQKTLLLNKQ